VPKCFIAASKSEVSYPARKSFVQFSDDIFETTPSVSSRYPSDFLLDAVYAFRSYC
jgi:hypothetical protein